MCSFFFSDEEGPVYQNCPVNATAQTDAGSDMAAVFWTVPVAIDNSGAMVTPSSNSRPGDMFAIGATPVSYVVLDPSNNVARCVFDVIVFGECFQSTG